MNRWRRRLLQMAMTQARGLVVIFVLSLIAIALQVAQPWTVKLALDLLRDETPPAFAAWFARLPGGAEPILVLAYLASASVAIFLVRRLNNFAKTVMTATVGTKMTMHCAATVFADLQRRSLLFHAERATGDLIRRVETDAGCVRSLTFAVLLPLLTSLITLVSILLVMWPIDWMLSLIALGLTAPLLVVVRLAAGPMTERTYEKSTAEGRITTTTERMLNAVPVVQAFAQEDREKERFEQDIEESLTASMRTLASQVWFKTGVASVTAIGSAIIMLIGGLKAVRADLTVGDLYLFIVYVGALYGPVESLAYLASGLSATKARARRIFEVLDAPETVVDPEAPVTLPATPGKGDFAVRWSDVRFGYEASRPVLCDISLAIRPGETVALVGASGVGKSTLVSLIPRFFDPWEGAIYVNGVDVRRVRLAELRSAVAWVAQDPMLLPMTLAENIAYGRPDASRDEIIEAATTANAHEFIERMPRGYDTRIGPRGGTVSGGQAQRIAIARAILVDAPVLILDEPTSALDAATEVSVMSALRRLCENRTAIIIAHRLSTVQRADRIFVLSEGRIAESGTHDELMSVGGAYHRLVTVQQEMIDDTTPVRQEDHP